MAEQKPYLDAIFYYQLHPECLQNQTIDIPVSVIGQDSMYSPGYLLSMNIYTRKCLVKVIVKDLPHPPVSGTSMIGQKQNPDFVYKEVNINQVTLMRNIQIEDYEYELPEVTELPNLQIFQNASKEQVEYAKFAVSYLESLKDEEHILSPDFSDKTTDTLIKWVQRVIIRKIGARFVSEVTPINKIITTEMLDERKFLNYLNQNVKTDSIYTKIQQFDSEFFTQCKNSLQNSLICKNFYHLQVVIWGKQFKSLFKSVMQNFLEQKDNTGQILQFLSYQKAQLRKVENDQSRFITKLLCKTEANIVNFSKKLTNIYNVDQLNYFVLLLLCFKQEIIPLIIQTEALIFSDQHSVQYQLVQNIIKQVIFSAFSLIVEPALQQMNVILTSKSQQTSLCTHLQKMIPILSVFGNKNFILSLFSRRYEISQDFLDQDYLDKSLRIWELEYSIIYYCFNCIQFDYVDEFNYINLTNNINLNFILFDQQNKILQVIPTQNTSQEVFRQLQNQFSDNTLMLKHQNIQLEHNNILESINQIQFQIGVYFLKDKLLADSVMIVKLQEQLNNLDVVSQSKIPHLNAPIKKIQELNQFAFNNINSDQLLINFNNFIAWLEEIKNIQDIIKQSQGIVFNIYFYQIDITQYLQEMLELLDEIRNNVKQKILSFISNFSDQIVNELTYIRKLYFLCQESPSYFKLGSEIQTFFSGIKLLTLYNSLEQVILLNYQTFFSVFYQELPWPDEYIDKVFKQLDSVFLLIKELQIKQIELKNYTPDVLQVINQVENWIHDSSKNLEIIVNTVIQGEIVQQYISLFDQSKLLSLLTFQIKQFDFDIDKNVEKLLLQSIAKCTELKIFSVNYSNKQLLTSQVHYAEHEQFTFLQQAQNNFRLKSHFYDTINTMDDFMYHIQFILFELSAIQNCTSRWRQWILSTLNDENAQFINIQTYASPSQLLLALYPLTTIINSKFYIEQLINCNMMVVQFPSEFIVQLIEKTIMAIKTVKCRSIETYHVLSNKADWFKAGYIKSQHKATVIKDQIILTLSYSEWLSYINEVEDFIRINIDKVVFLYFLQDPHFEAHHFQKFQKITQIPLDKQLNQNIQQLFKVIVEKPDILDVILILRQNVRIDQDANEKLQEIFKHINSIIVTNIYTVQTSQISNQKIVDNKLVQQLRGNSNIIDMSSLNYVQISPIYADSICSEVLAQISLYINNLGFQGKRTTQCENSYDIMFEQLYLDIYDAMQSSSQNQEQHEMIKQWRYSAKIESKSRDIEALSQVLKMILTSLKYLPTMLYDLLLLYNNNQIIRYVNPRLQFSVSFITGQQEKQLIQYAYTWKLLQQQYITVQHEIPLLKLIYQQDFCEKLTQLYQNIQQLYHSILDTPFSSIINTFTQIIENNKFQQIIIKEEILNKIEIIPHFYTKDGNLQVYYKYLTLNMPFHIKFQEFTQNNRTFNNPQFLSQYYYGVETLIYDQNQISGLLLTKNQQYKFIQNIQSPGFNYQVLDELDKICKQTLISQALHGWDLFNIVYLRFVEQKQNLIGYSANQIEQDLQNSFFSITDQHILQIVINTHFINYYRVAIKNFKVQIQIQFLDIQLQFINDLLLRYADFIEVQNLLTLYLTLFKKLLSAQNFLQWKNSSYNDNITVQILDVDDKKIFIQNVKQEYSIESGYVFANMLPTINTQLQEILSQIFILFSKRQSVFLLGAKQQGIKNKQFLNITTLLSLQLQRRVQEVFFSSTNFQEQFKLIEKYILCGSFVIIYGLITLDNDQVQELVHFTKMLTTQTGCCKYHYISQDITNISLKQKGLLGSIQQKTLMTRPVQFTEVENLGNIIFFIPELQFQFNNQNYHFSTQSQEQFQSTYEKIQIKVNEYKSKSGIVSHQQFLELQLDQNIKKQIQRFYLSGIVELSCDDTLQSYNQLSQVYGASFFDLSLILLQFDKDFIKIKLADISRILNRVNDINDIYSVASTCCDYIMKLSQKILSSQEDNNLIFTMLSYIIASVFGLDQVQAAQLMSQARVFYQYNEASLQSIGIQRQHNKVYNIKTSNFANYYNNYFEKNLNRETSYKIHVIHELHQVSLQCAYDIIFINEILSIDSPLMLISFNQTYLKKFFTLLQVIYSTKIIYIYDQISLQSFIQQNQFEIIQKSILLFIYITTISDLFTIIDTIQQLYSQSSSKIQVIVSIDYSVYKDVGQQAQLYIFNHKFILIPTYQQSVSDKRLFLSQLYINKYYYSQILETKLGYLWLKDSIISGSASELLRQDFKLKALVSVQKDQYMMRLENRTMILQSFLHGIYAYLLDTILQVFGINPSFEEGILIRNLIFIYLQKNNVCNVQKRNQQNQFLNIAKTTNQQLSYTTIQRILNTDNQSLNIDTIQRLQMDQYCQSEQLQNQYSSYLQDEFDSQRLQIQNVQSSIVDIGGYDLQNLIENHAEYEKLIKTTKDKEQTLNTLSQQYLSSFQQFDGQGLNGSIKFEFQDKFLFEYYFKPTIHEDAFKNIFTPLFASIWNTILLFYINITHGNKQHIVFNKQFLTTIQQKLDSVINMIITGEQLTTEILTVFVPITALLAYDYMDLYPTLNKEVFKNLNYKNFSPLHKINTGLTQEQQLRIIKLFYQKAVKDIPQKIPSIFSYYHFIDNIILFKEYQLGQDILQNLTDQYEKDIINNVVSQVSQQIVSQRLSQSNLQNSDSIIDQNLPLNVISIQKLSHTQLFIDQHRASFIVLLGASLISSITISITGSYQTGKSTLLNIAKLFIRNMIDPVSINLQEDMQNNNVISQILSSITQKIVRRNYKCLQSSRYPSSVRTDKISSLYDINSSCVLDYYQSLGFPTFHFDSKSKSNTISSDIVLLLRDHILKFSQKLHVQIDNIQQKCEGISSLSDCCFIIECDKNSQLVQLTSIQLHVPILEEQYYVNLFSIIFPQYSLQYIKQFANGFIMLKSSFDFEFMHNFQFIVLLLTNQRYIVNNQITDNFNIQQQTTSVNDNVSILLLQNQSIQQSILDAQDNMICTLSVHSLFNVFSQVLDQSSLQHVLERLATLDILGYLNDIIVDGETIDNPWQDCQIVIDQDFKLKSSWETYIYNSSIFNHFIQNEVPTFLRYTDSLIAQSTKHFPISQIESLLDSETLIGLGYSQINQQYFINIMKIYQNLNYDSSLTISIVKKIVNLLFNKEVNQAQLSSFLSYGIEITDSNSLSGICSENDSQKQRYCIVQQSVKFASLICKFIYDQDKAHDIDQQFDQLYQQDLELFGIQDDVEQDQETTIGGLPYSTSYISRIFYDKINILHYSSQTNDQITQLLKVIINSDIIHESQIQLQYPVINETQQGNSNEGSDYSTSVSDRSSQVSSQSSIKQKIRARFFTQADQEIKDKVVHIVDVSAIQNQILTDSKTNLQGKGFNITNYIIDIIGKYRKTNKFTDQQLDLVQIFMILRISVGMCLGIRPDIVVAENYDDEVPELFAHIKINSKLTSLFPSKIISNGRFLSSLPIKCTNWDEMSQKYISQKRNKRSKSKLQLLDDMTMMPLECILLIDSFTLNYKINSNFTIKDILTRLLNPMNIVQNLFTIEELQCLTMLICHNYQIESIVHYKMISSILASNLSIIEINNTPKLQSVYKDIESINLPVFQVNQFQKHKIHDKSKVFKSFLQSEKSLKPILLKVQKQHERQYYSNLLTQKRNSLYDIYLLSGCKKPEKMQYKAIHFNFSVFEQDLIYSQTAVYKEFSKYNKSPVINFIKFTEICVSLSHQILSKLYILDFVYEKTQNMLGLYERLAEPAKQEFRQLQIQEISISYFQGIINKLLSKIYSQSVQDGIPLTADQQRVQASVAEAVMMRDFFKSTLSIISQEIMSQQVSLKSLAIDVVGAVSFLIFGLNDNLDDQQFLQAIHTGSYGDLGAHLTKIYNNLDTFYDKFNFQYLLILQFYGFNVRHSEQLYKDRVISTKLLQSDTVIIGNNTLTGGKFMMLNNIIEQLKPDWPILPVIQYYNFPWQIGDPYYCILQSALLNYNIGISIQFIDDKLARAAGLCIASQFYNITSQNIVTQLISGKDYDHQVVHQFVEKLQSLVVIINICDPLGISLQKLKSAILDQKVIVFNSFRTKNVNIKLLYFVRKLILQKISPQTKYQNKIIIGPLRLTSQIPLKDIPIVLGFDSKDNIHDILKQLDLYQVSLIDNSSIQCLNISEQQQGSNQQYTICENLVTEVFGPIYNDRYSKEQIRVAKTQILISINALHKLYMTYFKANIFAKLDKLTIEYNKDTFEVAKIQTDHIIVVIQEISVFMQSNKAQSKMLDVLFKSVKTFSKSRFQLVTLIDLDQYIDEVNGEFELLCLSKQLIKKSIYDNLLVVSQSIQSFQYVISQLQIIQTPLANFTSSEFMSLLIQQIRQQLILFKEKIISQLSTVTRELSDKEQKQYDVQIFVDIYPLFYLAKNQPNDIIIFIASCALSVISTRLSLMVPQDVLSSLWLIAYNIIFGVSGLLSIDSIRAQYFDISLINSIFTNKYQDYAKMVCAQALSLSFNPNNIFSIQKMYSSQQIHKQLKKIQNIKQVIPELCRMSSQLQYSWITMQALSRYNKLMKNTMQFFLKNTATFVNLSKVKSPLLSMIRGFSMKNPQWLNKILTKSEEHRWLFDQLYKTAEHTQVQVPPKGFNINEYPSYHAMFLISSVLKPENIIHEIETLSTLISGSTGGSPFQLVNSLLPSVEKQASGICNNQYVANHDDLITCFTKPFHYFKNILQFDEQFSISTILDPVIYQICQQIISILNKSAKDNISFGVIFYDQYFHISKLIQNVMINLQEFRKFEYIISDEEITDDNILQITLIDVFTFNTQIQNITNNVLQAKISQTKLHPWIILIPSCLYAEYYTSSINRQLSQSYISNWTNSLYSLMNIIDPIFCYLQRPSNPLQSFQHIFTIIIQSFYKFSPSPYNIRLTDKESLLTLVLSMSLQDSQIESDQPIFNHFEDVAKNWFQVNYLSYNIIETTSWKFSRYISMEQLDFDESQKQLVNLDLSIINILPQQLVSSVNEQRTISLNSNDAVFQIQNDKGNYSDDEGDDVDNPEFMDEDSFSKSSISNMSSSVEQSSQITGQESSDGSTNMQCLTNEPKQKVKVQKPQKIIFDDYNVLINALQNFKDPFINVLDPEKMHDSVYATLNQQNRSIVLIDNIFETLQFSTSNISISEILQKLKHLNTLISIQSPDQVTRTQLRCALNIPLPERLSRAFLSCRESRILQTQNLLKRTEQNFVNSDELSRMFPSQLAIFFKSLNQQQNPLYFTNFQQPYHFFQTIFQSQLEVVGQQTYFHSLENIWKINGQIAIFELGNILNFQRILHSLKTVIPLQFTRVIGLLKRPKSQLILQKNGDLVESSLGVFSIEVTNLQLFGASFDPILGELVNYSTADLQGFEEEFSVYFAVVTTENLGELEGQSWKNCTAVSRKYVPIPVRCGGICKPIVLVENSGKFAAEEILRLGAFFGVGAL
ncbi:hypothetical protein SS50377_26804 [Spironucleus salmonicida]|uniref:Uncharacterized protein n=1 Tax=Spironucleus salmonicida TaxID=348837 RepID=V6M771_9EUKA|nr:hypothetical protein SS50377_26804 [Spironucleus salmonicida]|eukprot:EST49274.1 hypothetical protein SS50377_10495 [Spironucleus salmonicida]